MTKPMSGASLYAGASDRVRAESADLTALRCTTCGRILSDADWCAEEARWVCPGYSGDGMLEQEAAAMRLGPYATRPGQLGAATPEHLPGFRWVVDPANSQHGWYEALVWPPAEEAYRDALSRWARHARERMRVARLWTLVVLFLILALMCR